MEDVPPVTALGFSVKPERLAGVTARFVVGDWPFSVAVIVALTVAATPVVEAWKVVDDWPEGTVIVAGTVTEGSLLFNATGVPPVGAALLMVTVPVTEFPPTTVEGFTDTDVAVNGLIVRVAVWTSPNFAEMTTDVWTLTPVVTTVNVAVVWPAGTVTVAGTVVEGSLLESLTSIPAA